MGSKLTDSKIKKALDWAYDKAINGVPKLDSAEDLANDYLKGSGELIEKVNRLIRWQNTKAATSGFITGLGGLIMMPATIPANILSVMYVQIRMIAAIAHMGGYNIKDDRVKTLVLACLAGDAIKDLVKDTGLVIGTKLATNAIAGVSGKTLTVINQRVGFRLVTKFGEKGAVNLGKMMPFVGGIIGGTVDAVATNIIGNIARDTFIGSGQGAPAESASASVPR